MTNDKHSAELARDAGLTPEQYFEIGAALRREAADEITIRRRTLEHTNLLNGKTTAGIQFAVRILRS